MPPKHSFGGVHLAFRGAAWISFVSLVPISCRYSFEDARTVWSDDGSCIGPLIQLLTGPRLTLGSRTTSPRGGTSEDV